MNIDPTTHKTNPKQVTGLNVRAKTGNSYRNLGDPE